MHEMGYCAGILEAVERRAAGRPVRRIGVRIGTLHRVVPEVFEQSFQLLAAGGVADGAGAEVQVTPVRAACASCGHEFDAAEPAPACPECASLQVRASGGDEVVLAWLEYRGPQAREAPVEEVPAESAGHIHPPQPAAGTGGR